MSNNNVDSKSKSEKSNADWWREIDLESDLENLAGYRETKEIILENDDLNMPEDEDYFSDLHDKIMGKVAQASIQKLPFWQRATVRKGIRLSVASVLALAVLVTGLETSENEIASTEEIVLHDAVSKSPDLEETVMVYQHKDDFFVDLARESFDHLSVDQMQTIMESESAN